MQASVPLPQHSAETAPVHSASDGLQPQRAPLVLAHDQMPSSPSSGEQTTLLRVTERGQPCTTLPSSPDPRLSLALQRVAPHTSSPRNSPTRHLALEPLAFPSINRPLAGEVSPVVEQALATPSEVEPLGFDNSYLHRRRIQVLLAPPLKYCSRHALALAQLHRLPGVPPAQDAAPGAEAPAKQGRPAHRHPHGEGVDPRRQGPGLLALLADGLRLLCACIVTPNSKQPPQEPLMVDHGPPQVLQP
mmetsp:Transcript_3215/g.7656  ORF Transcript_3215/g.7656 Transcript_3215/m.7656 type:complete len:246 (+) Transcript_3215:622-1359(+)